MAKLSRSAFLYSLGATGIMILAGCGSGTEKNSSFGGSYRSAYTIPQLNETGIFLFTVGTKGDVRGSFDNQSGKVREFTGQLNNNGSLTGSTVDRTTNTTGSFSGTVAGSGQAGIPDVLVDVTGGDFTLTENNVPYVGAFTVGETPAAPGTSGFQGFYNGVYNIPELNQNGTTSFSVDSAGKMTGQLTRNDETGLLTGTVQSTGNFTASVAFRSETTQLTGTLIKTADNSTLGNFTQTVGGRTVGGSFGPTTVQTGDSQFAGAYRGTYSIPEQGENGNISFTVDPSGSLTGFFSQSNNSPVATFTGAFNNDGRFTGSLTYEPSTGLASRAITGKLGTSQVNSQLAGDFVMTIDGLNKPGNFEVAIGASEPDSIFLGTYSGPSISDGVFISGTTNSRLDSLQTQPDADSLTLEGNTTGTVNTLSLSVDKQGSLIGAFGGVSVSGRVTNDGRVTGKWGGFNLQGVISKQQIKDLTTFTITQPTFDPATGRQLTAGSVSYSYEDLAGFAGNLTVTVNGTNYNVTLRGIGGTTGAGQGG